MPERLQILISCEHGGNRVPKAYAPLFRNRKRLLASHRAYDAGSLQLARHLSGELQAPLYRSTVTRLLVDLNRSPGHPRLFSEATRNLGEDERKNILKRFYFPYREAVAAAVSAHVARASCVLHLSVHSFTPTYRGKSRRTDIGLLYDPTRRRERTSCDRLRATLRILRPDLRIHRNAPYRGVADGLTTALRRHYPADRYMGIELEVNQRLIKDKRGWLSVRISVTRALQAVLTRQDHATES